MLSINQLMKYLRNHHQISVKSNQAQSLRNIGYYHGYKGYRFIRTPNQRIPFSSAMFAETMGNVSQNDGQCFAKTRAIFFIGKINDFPRNKYLNILVFRRLFVYL